MDGHGPERRLGPGRDAIRHNERREIDSFVRGGAPEKEEKGAPNQTPLSCHPRSQPTAAHRGREGSLLLPLAASCPPPHKGPMIHLSCPSRAHPSSLPSSASGELVRLKRAICVFSSSPPPRRSLASEDACTYQDAPAAFPIPYTTLCLMTILIQQSLRRPWGPPPYNSAYTLSETSSAPNTLRGVAQAASISPMYFFDSSSPDAFRIYAAHHK